MDRAGDRLCLVSRREFLRAGAASGIAFTLTRLAAAQEPAFAARETLPGRQSWNPAATRAGRIDGVAKVTGAKLYASDFRAADMPGWPSRTSHALLLRVADATHVYAGLDLSPLSGALKPAAIATAEDLVQMGARVPAFYAGDLLCPVGKNSALSWSANRDSGLRGLRRLGSGAPGVARPCVRQVRGGNRPGGDA